MKISPHVSRGAAMQANERADTILIVIKTVAKWITWGVGALAILALVGIGGMYGYDEWNDRPSLVQELNGIGVDQKLSDVIFRHEGFELSESRSNRAPNEKVYEKNSARSAIWVADERVSFVQYWCQESGDYTGVNRIYCNDSGDKIFEKFSNRVSVQCSSDVTASAFFRSYTAREFGVRFYLVRNKVRGFGVFPPSRSIERDSVNWTSCP